MITWKLPFHHSLQYQGAFSKFNESSFLLQILQAAIHDIMIYVIMRASQYGPVMV